MTSSTFITLTGPGLSVGKQLNITVSISAKIELDAAAAQHKATAWLVSEVGNLLMGDTPSLVIGAQTVWRVPVLLSSPSRGIVGQVGSVDIDATSGAILADPSLAQELAAHARQLARSSEASAD